MRGIRVILFLVAAAACNARSGSLTGINSPPATTATVRVVNAAFGGPAVDVAITGTTVTGGTNLAFGDTSRCVSVTAASPALAVRTAGSTTPLSGLVLTLQASARYTLLVLGAQGDNRFMTLVDPVSIPAVGHAQLRIVNAALLRGGTVDVYVTPPGVTQSVRTVAGLAPNSASAFVDVASGSMQVTFTAAGTSTLVLHTATVEIADRSTQTLVFTEATTGSGFGIVRSSACPAT